MEKEITATIIIFFIILVLKLVQKYMIEHNIYKEKISSIESKKDDFINKYYKWILVVLIIVTTITRFYKFGEIHKI